MRAHSESEDALGEAGEGAVAVNRPSTSGGWRRRLRAITARGCSSSTIECTGLRVRGRRVFWTRCRGLGGTAATATARRALAAARASPVRGEKGREGEKGGDQGVCGERESQGRGLQLHGGSEAPKEQVAPRTASVGGMGTAKQWRG